MRLSRFEPWSIVDLLERDFDRVASRHSDTSKPQADWVPAVDIVEEKDRFVLQADVPGVDPAEIDISMDAGVLTVSGQRGSDQSDEHSGFRRLERLNGRFLRRFKLPDTANADAISATSNHGTLLVSIPKQAVAEARRIAVEAA